MVIECNVVIVPQQKYFFFSQSWIHMSIPQWTKIGTIIINKEGKGRKKVVTQSSSQSHLTKKGFRN